MTIFNFNFNKNRAVRQGWVSKPPGFLFIEFLFAVAIFAVTVVICSRWCMTSLILKEQALKRLLQMHHLYSKSLQLLHRQPIPLNDGISQTSQKFKFKPKLYASDLSKNSCLPIEAVTLQKKESNRISSLLVLIPGSQ